MSRRSLSLLLALLALSTVAAYQTSTLPATTLQRRCTSISALATLADLEEFQQAIDWCKSEETLMLVEYTQPRCNACRAIAAKLEQLGRNYPIRVFNVDAVTPGGKEITRLTGRPKALPRIDIYKDGLRMYDAVHTVNEWKSLMSTLHYFGLPELQEVCMTPTVGSDGLDDGCVVPQR